MKKLKFDFAKAVQTEGRDYTHRHYFNFEDGTTLEVAVYEWRRGNSVEVTIQKGGGAVRSAVSKREDKAFSVRRSGLEESDAIYFFSAGLPCRLTYDGILVPKEGLLEAVREVAKGE